MISQEEKINHLAHLLMDGIWKDDLVDYRDEALVLKIIKNTIKDYFHLEDQLDEIVRKKISSQTKNIIEGSREWEILYHKYFQEETKKKKL